MDSLIPQITAAVQKRIKAYAKPRKKKKCNKKKKRCGKKKKGSGSVGGKKALGGVHA
jgi:hypothetical protein